MDEQRGVSEEPQDFCRPFRVCRGLAGISVQLRRTLFQSKRKDGLCLAPPGLRGRAREGVTNLLPCNDSLWGKSFKGTSAGQPKKPPHLDWQRGKHCLCSWGGSF